MILYSSDHKNQNETSLHCPSLLHSSTQICQCFWAHQTYIVEFVMLNFALPMSICCWINCLKSFVL